MIAHSVVHLEAFRRRYTGLSTPTKKCPNKTKMIPKNISYPIKYSLQLYLHVLKDVL